MKKILLLVVISVFNLNHLFAQNYTYSEHIAPILYSKCTSCHRQGSIGPFAIDSYSSVLPYAYYIKAAVENKDMPPWSSDPSYRHFARERILTDDEISKISSWVTNGAPQGNPALEPPLPVFPVGGTLGTSDVQLSAPSYTVNTTQDLYRVFVIPSGLASEKYLAALEVIPGNREIVHHVLVYTDTTGACAALDAADPGPGYTSFGGVGSNAVTLISGWVPGSTPAFFPQGMGIRVAPGADIVIQIHYPGGTTNAIDQTKLNIFWTPDNNVRRIRFAPILNHMLSLVNGPLVIPADTVMTFIEEFTVPVDLSLLSVGPHMHLIGKSMVVYAVTPALDTIPLIRIKDWDFHWQGSYGFPNLVKIPAGSKLRAEAVYDNTSNNHHNPNNPPQTVSLGESTTDEMMLVYFGFLTYLPGDENISLENPATSIKPIDPFSPEAYLFEPFPNPASNIVNLTYNLPSEDKILVRLYDLQGQALKMPAFSQNGRKGKNYLTIPLSNLSSGEYIIRMETSNRTLTRKFLVSKN